MSTTANNQSPDIFPVFLSGYRCIHSCAYCNARGSSGVTEKPDLDSIRQDILDWLDKPGGSNVICEDSQSAGRRREVALYGNDLLSLPQDFLLQLMVYCKKLLTEKRLDGLRTSLRPDSILHLQPENLSLFSTIEIGVPSMDPKVLKQINRGHSPGLIKPAIEKLRSQKISVGLQTMIGLPGATLESDLDTARKLAETQPDFVRIHPTLVLRNSPLEAAWKAGEYKAMDLESALDRTVKVFQVYEERGVNVARCGFHLPEDVRRKVFAAGPWHPAYGQLVKSRILRNRFYAYLSRHPDISEIKVPLRELSDALGQKRSNVKWLSDKLGRRISIVGE